MSAFFSFRIGYTTTTKVLNVITWFCCFFFLVCSFRLQCLIKHIWYVGRNLNIFWSWQRMLTTHDWEKFSEKIENTEIRIIFLSAKFPFCRWFAVSCWWHRHTQMHVLVNRTRWDFVLSFFLLLISRKRKMSLTSDRTKRERKSENHSVKIQHQMHTQLPTNCHLTLPNGGHTQQKYLIKWFMNAMKWRGKKNIYFSSNLLELLHLIGIPFFLVCRYGDAIVQSLLFISRRWPVMNHVLISFLFYSKISFSLLMKSTFSNEK